MDVDVQDVNLKTGSRLTDKLHKLRKPWIWAVVSVALMPLFPEYVCPILAIFSLVAAHYDAKSHHREISVGLVGKLLIVYIGFMAVGVLYSKNTMNSIATVLMWLDAFLVYMALSTVLNSRRRFDKALLFITITAGIVGLIACLQYVLNIWFDIKVPFYFWQKLDYIVYENFPMPLWLDIHEPRSASTFTNQNVMAEYFIMVIPFVAYYAFSKRKKLPSFVGRMCLLLALGGVACSFSRGAYLAVMVMVLVFCVANVRRWSLLVMGGISVLSLIPSSVFARLFSVGSMDGSISERLGIWNICLDQIVKTPLLGLGPGIQNVWDTLIANGIYAPHAHNLFLQLLMEGGIIALGLIAAIAFKVLYNSMHMIRQSRETRSMGAVFIAFIGAFATFGMVDFPFLCPKLVCTFMLAAGFADATSHIFLGENVRTFSHIFSSRPALKAEQNAVYSKTK